MRDVRSSPPPILEDAERRAVNRAHADAQKRRKDAKAAKRTKHILAREELDKRRRQQRKDGLPLEESPSTSLSTEASDGDDKVEGGRGPLDHLPDVVEVAPGVSDGAGMPFVAEAPEVSEAEATEATAPATAETAVAMVGVSSSAEATMSEARDPETAEAVIAEAGAPEVTKTVVMAVRPSV